MGLSEFGDFVKVTSPSFMTGPEDIVSDAMFRTTTLDRFVRGRSPQEILQGGETIRDVILFNEDSTGRFYGPQDPQTYRNPQPLQQLSVPWRFYIDEMTWTDQETMLNGMSGTVRFKQFKNIKWAKEQRRWMSYINFWERQLWKLPVAANMESSTGLESYSIPAFVNGRTNGLYSGWTTKAGLDPTSADTITGQGESGWVPQQGTYAANLGNGLTSLLTNLDILSTKTQFIPCNIASEYQTNASYYGQVIFTSKLGYNNYKRALRSVQDTLVYPGRQDSGFMHPTHNGVEVVPVDYLDTAALYDNAGATAFVSETAADLAGARFYLINTNFLRMFFHSERFMYEHEYMRDVTQPSTWVMPFETWGNLFPRSLRRQGFLAPSADITD